MQISSVNTLISKPSFKGWDASIPLKSLVLTDPGYNCKFAEELDVIGKNNGFDVFVLSGKDLQPMSYINEEIPVPQTTQQENISKEQTKQQEKIPKEMNLFGIKIKIVQKKSLEQVKKRGFIRNNNISPWAQDLVTITPDKKIQYDIQSGCYANAILEKFDISFVKNAPNLKHIQGGNLFFVKNDKGYELLVGFSNKHEFTTNQRLNRHELTFNQRFNFDNLDGEIDYDYLKEFYGVNKIIFLPQMDFHLDLFVRPLDKKNILVTDDNMTIDIIEKGIKIFEKVSNHTKDKEKSKQYTIIKENLNSLCKRFKENMRTLIYSDTSEVAEVLESEKYNVIKVPGRLYSVSSDYDSSLIENIDPKHLFNYMNAIVTKNQKDELVYITNKSTLDKSIGITPEVAKEVGFSFEEEFKKSISEYVKPENIYFISGEYNGIQDKLYNQGGGIHCLTTEIPNL